MSIYYSLTAWCKIVREMFAVHCCLLWLNPEARLSTASIHYFEATGAPQFTTLHTRMITRRRASAIGRATGYRLDGQRVWSSSSSKGTIFLLSTASRPALRPTQPSTQGVLGVHSPAVKRQRREADHSLPTNTEVKKTMIYKSTPPLRIRGLDNFTLSFAFFVLPPDSQQR
jgi:hypothetical protein